MAVKSAEWDKGDKPIQIFSKKFPSYKIILLVGGIFFLEFQ